MKSLFQKRKKRPCVGAVFLCVLAVFLTSCSGVGEYGSADTVMGTILSQQIYGREDVTGKVKGTVEELERELLSWRIPDSELAQINANAGRKNSCSPEMSELLHSVFQVSEKSEGALDITIGEVTRLWNIDAYAAGLKEGDFEEPPEDRIEEALCHSGYEKVALMADSIFLPEGMQLDLGAVGKGIACDALLAMLAEEESVKAAVISVGGSVLTYGQKPDGSAFRIALADPFQPSDYLGILTLSGEWCVSSSGDYERYVEADGVSYHHIFDPDTGRPADSGLKGVSIVSRSGLLSDALSTACFVLGREKGMALLEEYEAEGLFVEKDGRITMTEGMRALFTEK